MAKPRHYRLPNRKFSTSALILTLLLVFAFLVLVLLLLGIFYMPTHPGQARKGNDLNNIVHSSLDSEEDGDDVEVGERWTAVLSREPRAFL